MGYYYKEVSVSSIDDFLKTHITPWDTNIPLDFPQTNNISNAIDADADELIVWRGHNLDVQYLSTQTPEQRDEIAKDVFNYLRKFDFSSYRVNIKKMERDWNNLKKTNILIEEKNTKKYISNIASTGNKVYRYFFPNLMKLKNGTKYSIYECLTNPEILWKIIRNRTGNTFLYTWDRSKPARQYPFNLTCLNMFIQGAKSTGLASHGSQFKPALAKAIYSNFVKEGDNVLDYSAGYGSRLLGFWAANIKDSKYYAYEPNTETYNGLVNMSNYFGLPASIKKCGSEEELFDVKFDFVMSSPPYFDQETYSVEESQAYIKNPKYEDFMENYWRKTVQNIKTMMKDNAVFGINIGNESNAFMIKIKNDFTRIIEEEGFVLFEEWIMKTSKSHLSNKRGTNNNIKEEGIYFYRRQE